MVSKLLVAVCCLSTICTSSSVSGDWMYVVKSDFNYYLYEPWIYEAHTNIYSFSQMESEYIPLFRLVACLLLLNCPVFEDTLPKAACYCSPFSSSSVTSFREKILQFTSAIQRLRAWSGMRYKFSVLPENSFFGQVQKPFTGPALDAQWASH